MDEKNPPAFPTPIDAFTQAPGMELRDFFAAKAMHQFLHGSVLPEEYDAAEAFRHVANRAYEMADAMLAARQQ